MEDSLNLKEMEDDLNFKVNRRQSVVNLSQLDLASPELGTAQPQLVFYFLKSDYCAVKIADDNRRQPQFINIIEDDYRFCK